jgi:hypothetical protein
MVGKISLPGLDAQIAEAETVFARAEAELSRLKAIRRPFVAGLASGRARQHAVRDAKIFRKYEEMEQLYGGVAGLADEFHVSRRQIHRIVERLGREHDDEQ